MISFQHIVVNVTLKLGLPRDPKASAPDAPRGHTEGLQAPQDVGAMGVAKGGRHPGLPGRRTKAATATGRRRGWSGRPASGTQPSFAPLRKDPRRSGRPVGPAGSGRLVNGLPLGHGWAAGSHSRTWYLQSRQSHGVSLAGVWRPKSQGIRS